MGKILLENMEFFAYHGCFREEQLIGNRFLVSLELETDTGRAELSDHLTDTVNYQAVYKVVQAQMTQNSHLLEHLGRRILDAVGAAFPKITAMRLKLSKMNPPMGGRMEAVSLELTRP